MLNNFKLPLGELAEAINSFKSAFKTVDKPSKIIKPHWPILNNFGKLKWAAQTRIN